MKRITEMRSRQLCLLYIISIGLVDNDTIGHLHDTAFDALQLISRTGQLDEQEEVDHRVNSRLTLSDTHRFNEYGIEAGSFAQNDRFACFAGDTSQ